MESDIRYNEDQQLKNSATNSCNESIKTCESLPDYGAEWEQIVWYSCVAKEKNHRNGEQKKGQDNKVRQHISNQNVWKKTQSTHLQTLDRAEETNKQTCKRSETTWKNIWQIYYELGYKLEITEILIICDMACANVTTVTRMAGLILKDIHVSLH